jgi:hypothetical protein
MRKKGEKGEEERRERERKRKRKKEREREKEKERVLQPEMGLWLSRRTLRSSIAKRDGGSVPEMLFPERSNAFISAKETHR